MNSQQAMLEITLLNAETSSKSFDEVLLEGLDKDIPPEMVTRMKELWEKTQVIGGELIEIGKIVVLKMLDFLKANPKLSAALALGAAIYLLTNSIPFLGQILAPLFGLVTTGYALVKMVGFDEAVQMAKDFFEVMVSIFNTVAARCATAK